MAIDDELKAQILRYHFVEHWPVGTIASQLGVHHSTVERVLGEAGVERERQRPRRPSKLDSRHAHDEEEDQDTKKMDFNEDLKKTPSKKMTSSPRPFTRIFGTALARGGGDGLTDAGRC